ncbi:hypothetical protein ACFL27_06415 [candidate division CSSED10-310 bacterium]|uniref:Uncharacterized protein n=1 Tax=candidate division CSSED10-310 bacterium TaxID=2855610 RepID=A0ABV6YUH2_UNCC1
MRKGIFFFFLLVSWTLDVTAGGLRQNYFGSTVPGAWAKYEMKAQS